MIDRLRRFAPKSLIGQIALVMAGALLVAQAINFTLIFTERQRLTRTQLEGPPVARFVTIAQRVAEAAPAERPNVLPRRGRRGRFSIDAASPIPPGGDEALLDRLRDTAAANGLTLRDARAAIIDDLRNRLRQRVDGQLVHRGNTTDGIRGDARDPGGAL